MDKTGCPIWNTGLEPVCRGIMFPVQIPAINSIQKKEVKIPIGTSAVGNRNDRIRTCDLVIPNHALLQTEPHPDKHARHCGEKQAIKGVFIMKKR